MGGIQTNQGTAESQKGLMNISSAFIPDAQTAITIQPGKSAFHDPAMLSQMNSLIDAAATQAIGNTAFPEFLPVPVAVIAPIPMQLFGSVPQFSIRS
jgi:hypothetical protein